MPATSSKVTWVWGSIWTRALLLPKLMAGLPPPPWARRSKKNKPPSSSKGNSKLPKADCHAGD